MMGMELEALCTETLYLLELSRRQMITCLFFYIVYKVRENAEIAFRLSYTLKVIF